MAKSAEIVVVQRMAHGPIGQRSVGQGAFYPRGQYCCLACGALVLHVFLDDLPHRLGRPRQDYAQKVEAGLVGDPDRVGRNIFVVGVDYPFSNCFRGAHGYTSGMTNQVWSRIDCGPIIYKSFMVASRPAAKPVAIAFLLAMTRFRTKITWANQRINLRSKPTPNILYVLSRNFYRNQW